MRSPETDPQKVLRHALARAGLVVGYDHLCRRCVRLTTETYGHLVADDLRGAVEQIAPVGGQHVSAARPRVVGVSS